MFGLKIKKTVYIFTISIVIHTTKQQIKSFCLPQWFAAEFKKCATEILKVKLYFCFKNKYSSS